MDTRPLTYVGAIGVCFGINIVASRFALGQFAPVLYVALRLSVAALSFVPLYLIAREKYPFPKDWKVWVDGSVMGVLGTAIPTTCFVWALQYQSSGVAAILVTTGPAITSLMAHFVLPDEHLNWSKSMGILFSLAGALILALSGETGLVDLPQANPLSYGLIALSLLFHSSGTIYARKFALHYQAYDLTAIQMLAGTGVLLCLASFFTDFSLERVDSVGMATVVFVGISSFAGFLLYYTTVLRYGATIAVMSLYVTTIVATLGGFFLLDEALTLPILGGMLVILVGITLVNYGSRTP